MLKFRFASFVAISLSAAVAFAQDPAPPAEAAPAAATPAVEVSESAPVKRAPVRKRRVVAKATPVPVATPIPKKAGFWERVFGKKKPTASPRTPTPTPVEKKKPVTKARTQKPKAAVTDPAGAATDVAPGKTADESTPPKSPDKPKVSAPRTGKPKATAQRGEDFPPSTDNADAEVVEKQKYEEAKAKANADPKVQELRGKADLASSEEESRKALRAYNKALFKRIKEIDPSIKEHADRLEAAVLSRLGE